MLDNVTSRGTTVDGGKGGLTLAPINAKNADYVHRMMAKVEDVSMIALENSVPWNWSSVPALLITRA